MMVLDQSALAAVAVASACGMLLGIERERRRADRPNRRHAGIRSFVLTAIIGALAEEIGGGLVLVGAVLVLLLGVTNRWRDGSAGARGIATELALFLCYLLGVGASANPVLVLAVAVVATAVLNLRDDLHRFARATLRPGELRAALVFAAAVAIVLPLLPDASAPWLLGVNPRALWILVVTIMGIQAAAHIALRAVGPTMGLAASGLASGFISGVATIAAMGARARETPELGQAYRSAALMSNMATFVLLWLVALAVAPGQLAAMAPILLAGTLAAAALAVLSLGQQAGAAPLEAKGSVFNIRQAVLFAAGLSVASAALAYANAHLGAGAAIAGAALAGFFDVHAASASALGLLANGAAATRDVQLSVLLAISSNMVSKAVGALAGGGRYALQISWRLVLILAATWLPYVFTAWN